MTDYQCLTVPIAHSASGKKVWKTLDAGPCRKSSTSSVDMLSLY